MTADGTHPSDTAGTALPVIRTERLAIRPLTGADGSACRAILDPPDESAFARWLAWAVAAPPALGDLNQPPYGERAVVLETGEVIGLVGLVPALHRSPSSRAGRLAGRGRPSSGSTGRSHPRSAAVATRPRPPARSATRSSRRSTRGGSLP